MNKESYTFSVGSQHHVDLLAEYVNHASHRKLVIVNQYKDYDNCRIRFTFNTDLEWSAIAEGIRIYQENLQNSRTRTI